MGFCLILKNAIYGGAPVCDHDVEMGLDAERILEEEIYQGTSAATLSSRGWFPEAATMRGWHHAYIGQPLIVAASDSAVLVAMATTMAIK